MASAGVQTICLALPNARWSGQRQFNIHPYAACVLGAVLKERYEVSIVDANLHKWSIEETTAEIAGRRPDVVGISGMSIEYAQSCHQLAKSVKEHLPGTTIIFGGAYPTLLPELAMKDENVDYVVLAEGERRLLGLLDRIGRGESAAGLDGVGFRESGNVVVQMNDSAAHIDDLDGIPFPAYDLIDFEQYARRHNKYSLYNNPRRLPYAVSMSSRGCPFRCVFCAAKHLHGRKWRMRSADNMLAEIDWLVQQHGIKELIFLDDNLLLDEGRITRFCQGLMERDYDLLWKATNVPVFSLTDELLWLMRRSGCYQITLPIESGNEEVLRKIIRKPLSHDHALSVISKAKDLEYEIAALFVIGLPGESWGQILETVQFAEQIDVDWVVFSIATPQPKTELYEVAKQHGYLEPGFDFSDFRFFGYGHGAITTDEFTPERLQQLRAEQWDRINFRTERKRRKIALMNSITMAELKRWRESTRESLGTQVEYEQDD